MACRGLSTLRAAAVATATGPRLRPLPSAAAIATALQQRLPRGGSPAAAVTPPALSTWRAAAGGPACPSYAQRAGTAPSSVSAHPSRPQALLRGGRSSAPPPPLLCRRRCLSAAAAPPPPPDEPPRGKPFLLADIGEGITTVTLSSWKVAVGDTVAAFDPISEVASDKASVEITAPWGGVIRGLAVAEGDTALVGKPLCWIDPGGEGGANDGTGGNDLASAAAAAEAGGGAAAVGASVAAGGGGGSGNGRAPASAADAREAPAAAAPAGRARVLAAPAVRARAREAGVDLARVDGTGPGGRVLAADVARVAAAAAAALPQDGAPFPPAAAAAAVADHREAVVQVPLTPVRSAMVRTMTDAAAIPHLRLITPVDVTALVGLRRRLNASLVATPPAAAAAAVAAAAATGDTSAAPVKLTYLPFFIRATSMALTAHPALNATFPAPHDAVHVHAGHHISVAVDTPAGLHVPTVRDAARRPVTQLAAEVARLARAAAAGRLGVAEVSGGTVGLSNIGALGGRPPPAATAGAAADGDGPPPPAGGMVGLPLLLPPQVLIGAVGDIVWEPRLDADGSVTRRAVVQVCWAADHRVVEGGAVARYAATWRELVECPERLLLGE